MKVELALKINDTNIGAKVYSIRDAKVLAPLNMVLADFSQSTLDWMATKPQASLDWKETQQFLTRNKDYVSNETMQLRIKNAEDRADNALKHIEKLERRIRELNREPARLHKQLRDTKRAAIRLLRNAPESALAYIPKKKPIKYYRIHVLNSWGPSYSRISYGSTAVDAVSRFRTIYKEQSAMIHVEQIENPKLKYVK